VQTFVSVHVSVFVQELLPQLFITLHALETHVLYPAHWSMDAVQKSLSSQILLLPPA
jgi:hypothetical protein